MASATGFSRKRAAPQRGVQKSRRTAAGRGPWEYPGGASERRFGHLRGRVATESQELKFHDGDLNLSPVGTTATLEQLCLIPQNVTESGRIGRKCTIRSIQMRGAVTIPEVDAAGTPDLGDIVRIVLFQDTQCNGAAAAVSTIFESDVVFAYANLANKSRYRILWQEFIEINYQGLASDGAGVVSQALMRTSFNMYKKVNIPLEFNGATGNISELRSNNVFVLLIGASAKGTVAQSHFRLRFSD